MAKNMFKTKAKDPTHAVFGLDLEGRVFSMPLSTGPHWIIAGQTGSGKSVFVNALLVSMISHANPEELKIFWIDPKKVEATAYVGLPFCPIDPITNMSDAYGFVAYLTWVMDERYELLADVGVKKVDEFNEWVDEDPQRARDWLETRGAGWKPDRPDARELLDENLKMAYYVLVIDEYADMVMQEPDVEKLLIRLGQKSRAASVHTLVSTQRPSADIITPTLRANLPSRVGLKTVDSVNSMIILEQDGCEKLRGNGDGYVKDVAGTITRVQGPYITNEEIDSIFAHLREKYGEPEPIEYKQKVVDLGLCEWEDENYTEDVPMADRHVVKKKRGFRR